MDQGLRKAGSGVGERGVTANGDRGRRGSDESVVESIVVMFAQLCEWTRSY